MTDLRRTPLYDLHKSLGAKMVPFAGYDMPVQYPAGILKEHQHTRAQAGLFDVSHMGQFRLSGSDAAGALEALVPGDMVGLAPNKQRYTLLTNENGGIIDDLMVANYGDSLLLVVNAACKADDFAHLQANLPRGCRLERLDGRALLALQGPCAAAVLARQAPEIAALKFMDVTVCGVAGAECFVSRSGYTGEDGFEISVPAERAEALARQLLDHAEVEAIGLGARDSLRLEAGLCLYGHDIDNDTTPVEASLNWTIPKVRRPGGARAGGFPGADRILAQLADGAARYRVGIRPEGRAPVREGALLTDDQGRELGHITSGGFGPSVEAPVAMGYVEAAVAAEGTRLNAVVRGKPLPASVCRLPFVPHRYLR